MPTSFLEYVCKLLSHLSVLKNLLLISVLWNYEWEDAYEVTLGKAFGTVHYSSKNSVRKC